MSKHWECPGAWPYWYDSKLYGEYESYGDNDEITRETLSPDQEIMELSQLFKWEHPNYIGSALHCYEFGDVMRELKTLAHKSAYISPWILIPKYKRGKHGRRQVVTFLKLGWMGDTSDWGDGAFGSDEEDD